MSDKTERQVLIDKLNLAARKKMNKAKDLIDEERFEVTRPLLRKSVGLCFKYMNSYGGDDAKWPIYVKILSFDEATMHFYTVQFQHTSRKRMEMEYRNEYNFDGNSRFDNYNGWIQIPAAEFKKAAREFVRFVGELLP